MTAANLGPPSPRPPRLLIFFIVVSFFLLFRGTLLWYLLLTITIRLIGSRRNIVISYMAGLPGSLELLLIIFPKFLETV